MPPALQNIFNGPYREGVSAITAVLDTQGRAGVDALLADPPASTEQLLHPDKLADREPPLTISDPDVIEALGSGWAAIDSDTFGEFQLRVYLDVELSRAAAVPGAGGWGGDRLTLYRAGDGDELIAWRLRWDDAAEAKEFLAQFRAWLVARSAGAVQPIAAGAGYRWTGENQAFWVYGREADTWLLVASDADDLNGWRPRSCSRWRWRRSDEPAGRARRLHQPPVERDGRGLEHHGGAHPRAQIGELLVLRRQLLEPLQVVQRVELRHDLHLVGRAGDGVPDGVGRPHPSLVLVVQRLFHGRHELRVLPGEICPVKTRRYMALLLPILPTRALGC